MLGGAGFLASIVFEKKTQIYVHCQGQTYEKTCMYMYMVYGDCFLLHTNGNANRFRRLNEQKAVPTHCLGPAFRSQQPWILAKDI